MALQDFLQFENPGVVMIAIGVLAFLVSFTIFSKTWKHMNRGTIILISLLVGTLVSSYLYRNGFEQVDSPIVTGYAVGLFILLASFAILGRAMENKKSVFFVSLAIATILGLIIYNSYLVNLENSFSILFLILALTVVVLLFIPFGKFLRSNV